MTRALKLPATTAWRKSSRSQNGANNCVEVAQVANVTAVRDSKNPTGPVLAFSPSTFATFLGNVREGQLRG